MIPAWHSDSLLPNATVELDESRSVFIREMADQRTVDIQNSHNVSVRCMQRDNEPRTPCPLRIRIQDFSTGWCGIVQFFLPHDSGMIFQFLFQLAYP